MDANDEWVPQPHDSAGSRSPERADARPDSLHTDSEHPPTGAFMAEDDTDAIWASTAAESTEAPIANDGSSSAVEPQSDGKRPMVDLTPFRGPLVDTDLHDHADQFALSASAAGQRAGFPAMSSAAGSLSSGSTPAGSPMGSSQFGSGHPNDAPSGEALGIVAVDGVAVDGVVGPGEPDAAVAMGSASALALAPSVLDLTVADDSMPSVGELTATDHPAPVDAVRTDAANTDAARNDPARNDPARNGAARTDDEDAGLVGDFLGAVSSLAVSRRKKIGAVLLLGWFALFVFTMTVVRHRVERELEESSRKVLVLNSQPGLKVDASGLTVSISGFVESPEDRQRAEELVRSRFGVRDVRNNLVIDAAKVASVQADDAANASAGTDPNGSSGSSDPNSASGSSTPTLTPSLPVRGPTVDVAIRPGADGSVGSVEVRGSVPTAEAKDALFARVSNIVPVERIASNVQIPTTVTEQPDMQAYRRLGSFLEIVSKTRNPDVRISFKDGNLTMSGSVSDLNDLALIRAEARNLVGANTFADTMTIANPAGSTTDSTVGPDGSTTSAPDGSGATTPTIPPVEIDGVGRTDTPAAKTAQVAVDAVIAGKVIAFEKNKALLTSDGRKLLNELATALLGSSDKTVKYEISGHTDDKGSESANLDLSTRRAEAVRDALIAKGVDASRLVAKGYGESDPVASNDTESGRSQNRRIQVRAAS